MCCHPQSTSIKCKFWHDCIVHIVHVLYLLHVICFVASFPVSTPGLVCLYDSLHRVIVCTSPSMYIQNDEDPNTPTTAWSLFSTTYHMRYKCALIPYIHTYAYTYTHIYSITEKCVIFYCFKVLIKITTCIL